MSTFIDGNLCRDEALSLLTMQDAAIRAFAAAWPAPRWIKLWRDGERDAVMAWVNGAYAHWYKLDPREYIGKPDSAIWPADVCERFRALDLKAIGNAGEIVIADEPTPRGDEPVVIARKFATRIDEGRLSGWVIYGEVCPLEITPCDHCPKKE